MTRESWKADVFDRLYARDPDPWRFETSAYEQAKYADTLAQLGDRHFGHALELGCSIGVLSRKLAARCDRLLALDLAEAALERARLHCAGLDHVQFRRATLPQDWPAREPHGTFDLVLISEMLYFLAPDDIARLAHRGAEAALPECTVLLVNWTGPTDTPTTGDEAAGLFRDALQAEAPGFSADAPLHRNGYRLDRLHRPAPHS
jgi:cyclopropane fatty-acyl-phospholipid synthase-like methyltransferase